MEQFFGEMGWCELDSFLLGLPRMLYSIALFVNLLSILNIYIYIYYTSNNIHNLYNG